MTLAAVDVDRLRDVNRADLATLREVPNLIDLLKPYTTPDGNVVPTVWWLMSTPDEDSHPTLVIGVRRGVGFLRWYDDHDVNQVPLGTEYRDCLDHEYFHGGIEHGGGNPGEEIPLEQVYAAAAQFVATGQRPTCIQWMNHSDVTDHRPSASPIEENPIYQAIKAATEDGL